MRVAICDDEQVQCLLITGDALYISLNKNLTN